MEGSAEYHGAAVREATNRGKDCFKISHLFVDETCSEAVLDFMATADVGMTALPVEGRMRAPSSRLFPRRERGIRLGMRRRGRKMWIGLGVRCSPPHLLVLILPSKDHHNYWSIVPS